MADCQRKVEAVYYFLSKAKPYNTDGLPRAVDKLDAPDYDSDVVKDRMELHRALIRRTGFYGWMTRFEATT